MIEIAEDLKQRYEKLSSYQPMEVAVTDIYVRDWQLLIERTSKAEQDNAKLRAIVKRYLERCERFTFLDNEARAALEDTP